jgi:thiamine pyrophosphokinase
MKILFIANGDLNFNIDLIKYDVICCIDGGLRHLIKMDENFIPKYIIGDFDSIDVRLLEKYKNKSLIIKKDNQDESDLLYGLKYILKKEKEIDELIFVGVKGNRIDHTLCNIMLLNKIPDNIKSKIMTNDEDIYFLKDHMFLDNVINKTISLIPLNYVEKLKTNGLKWELNDVNLELGYINGISNVALKNKVEIAIRSGLLLVILNKVNV